MIHQLRVHVANLKPRHLFVEGELDVSTRSILGDALTEAGPFQDVTLDMSGVTFIDSTGLNLLLVTDREHRGAGTRLVISRPSRDVARLLDVTGLHSTFIVELENPTFPDLN